MMCDDDESIFRCDIRISRIGGVCHITSFSYLAIELGFGLGLGGVRALDLGI